MNLAALVLEGVYRDGRKTAFLCEGQDMSGQECLQLVGIRQATLRRAGVVKSATVLVPTGRGKQFWLDLVALWGIGAVPVPVEERPTQALAGAISTKASPTHIMEPTPVLRKLFPQLQPVTTDIEEPAASDPIAEDLDSTDEGIVIFTSGSTGIPKGVSLSHGALLSNVEGVRTAVKISPDDRVLVSIPFRFASAICHFLAVVSSGGIFMGFEKTLLMGDFIRAIVEHRASAVGGSPMQMRWISETTGETALPLRWVMSSGDHLPRKVIDMLRERIPEATIYNVYGLTEVGGRFCIRGHADQKTDPGAVGKPIPGLRISILDDTGTPVRPGEEGHIYASGASLMQGYRGDPEITARSLTPQGFATGDLGYLDDQGCVHVTGRADDVFKSGGRKVSTSLIATTIMEIGVFADVAVCPVEHSQIGLVAVAFYTMKGGNTFARREVMRHLRAKLPSNHVPYSFVEVDKIPRTGSGKLDRTALRELSGSVSQDVKVHA